MREQIRIWAGAAAVVAIYLLMCHAIEEREARIQQCSIVRCT
jgi:hypothetical protein